MSVEVAAETSDLGALAAGRARAARLEQSSGADETRAMAQLTQGSCLIFGGFPDQATGLLRNSARLLDGLSLDPELRLALNLLAVALVYTGSYREAISTLRRALQVASRSGDSAACGVCWSSLGVVYEDLGRVTTAEECYTKAVALASNPRRACEIHVNLAGLMILVGDFIRARQSIEIAKQQGTLSQLWWLERNSLLIEADYHIAEGNPESAWPLVEEAQVFGRGRTYALGGMPRFQRLTRHYLWATEGVEAMTRFARSERARHLTTIRGQLEVRAFEEWVLKKKEGLRPQLGASAFEELRQRKLHGTLAYLRALHITDTGTGEGTS